MYQKKHITVFCLACAGQFFNHSVIAQPPGLQGPFIPIEVVSVQPNANDTVAVIDYYAQTTDYADLYAREADTFDKSTMVGLGADIIGTPWEGATCAALLDAGFDEPCAIPPQWPPVEIPEEYEHEGTCNVASTSGYPSPPAPWPSTKAECEQFMKGTVKDAWDASAQPTNGPVTIACGPIGHGGSSSFAWYASRVGFGNSWMGHFAPSDPLLRCNVIGLPPDPLPPEPEPPTTEEVYEAILPAINNQYFYDYSTQRVINNNSTINNTSISITNNYTTYQGDWMSGDPMVPPDLAPIPLPPAPSAADPVEQAPDCEVSPSSVGCADADSFVESVGASVAENLVEDVDMVDGEAAAADVAAALTDGLQAVGDGGGDLTFDGDIFAPFTGIGNLLPAAGACQSFEYSLLPEYGMSLTIDTCQLSIIKTIAEWALYVLTIFALYRIALGRRGEE